MLDQDATVPSVREEVHDLFASLNTLMNIPEEKIEAELRRTEAQASLLRSLLCARQAATLPAPKPTAALTAKQISAVRAKGTPGRARVSPFAVKPGALKPTGKEPPDADSARKVALFLRINGPKRVDGLRNAIDTMGVTQSQLDDALRSNWFERAGACWNLSSDGQAQVRRDD